MIVGEVQTGIDPEKVWTWPEYVAFALTEEVAKWARKATSDAGMIVHAIVLGPEDSCRRT